MADPLSKKEPHRQAVRLGWLPRRKQGSSRIPTRSTFYSRVVPALLLFLAGVTVLLILFALGILIGVVPFR